MDLNAMRPMFSLIKTRKRFTSDPCQHTIHRFQHRHLLAEIGEEALLIAEDVFEEATLSKRLAGMDDSQLDYDDGDDPEEPNPEEPNPEEPNPEEPEEPEEPSPKKNTTTCYNSVEVQLDYDYDQLDCDHYEHEDHDCSTSWH